jgi:hypothetical protein
VDENIRLQQNSCQPESYAVEVAITVNIVGFALEDIEENSEK